MTRKEIRLKQALEKVRTSVLKPPPTLTLSEWSQQYLYLSPEASALPGKFRFDRAEFQREVFDALSDQTHQKVVICAASQLLKSQSLISYIGYIIHLDPGPILIIQPTKEMAESFSKDRIATMLRDTPILKGRVRDSRERDSGNTVTHKQFPGGHLTMVGSNSPSQLAARPIRYLFCDEVDRYEVTKEGDPINIAHARTTTFFNAKEILVSSPGDEDTSRIWQEYQASDQRVFEVPCHHCGHEAPLEWANVRFDPEKPKRVRYECPKCKEEWTNHEKNLNVKQGKWVKRNPSSNVAGFWISALYSSFKSLEALVEEFLEAKKDPDQLKVFINTRLAQVWQNESKTVSEIDYLNRLEDYHEDAIPNDVVLITCGIDTQIDRLEMEVVGWGPGDETWSLEYNVLHGDPTSPAPWEQLEEYFTKKYTRRDGLKLPIHAFCIDSGGQATQDVYSFTNRHKGRNVYAIKGIAGPRAIFPKKMSRTKKGRVYIVGVDTAKERLYQQLQLKEAGPGYCHFPADRDDPAYYEQLTAERYTIKYKFGRPKKVWILPPNRRNEALDCRVYAMAARHSFQLDLDKRAETLKHKAAKLEKDDGPIDEHTPVSTTQRLVNERAINNTSKRRVRQRRPGGGYISGMR